MKTCPTCHRPVADDAHVCPHPGCGKPLISPAAANRPAPLRPPPPPRKISLEAADLPAAASKVVLSKNRGGRSPHRRRAATAALMALAAIFCGGVYYAARLERAAPAVVQAPQAGTQNVKPANPPPDADDAEGKPSKASADRAASSRSHEKSPVVSLPRQNEDFAADATKPETATAQVRKPEVLGLYSQRTAPNRETWIAELGGTMASEQAVAGGLDWLARHQAPDGHWGPDCLGATPGSLCVKGQECTGRGGSYEAALTGLAVLAFQAGGHYHFNGRLYSGCVARALDYLVARQGFHGELVGSMNDRSTSADLSKARFDHCYMYEHGIASFALCEACAVAKASRSVPSPKLMEAAAKAVKFIELQQHLDGGWRYTVELGEPSDTSVSGWSMLALKTAREAEIALDERTIPRLVEFFDREQEPLTGRTHYTLANFNTDALTGVGMLVDEFILLKRDTRRIALASLYLADQAEERWGPHKNSPADYYLWYNCTLAMFQAGGEPWQRWNAVVRDRVVSLQERGETCRRGSWPPNDRWSGTGGRIYSTALAVLTLEAYYRFAQERLIAERPAN
ncbi:MAG TPA: prenyltransferase/squalene oxidase repeat-containing protein [Pirellulales bacterium]|nr:prenyltransferase/squalene oxidase repeat-containing protein [Pirellulales bacterium]